MSAPVWLELDPASFRDRREAGERLARALSAERTADGLVVGLARGGVEVAASVAERLALPLDALAVRKVGHPGQPEYALGAVTPGGGRYVRAHDDLSDEEVEAAVAAAVEKADDLDRRLHADRPALDPAGRTVLLVDDGLATGATMIAAARWARAAGAARVVVAVPVGAAQTVELLAPEADDVVCLERPAYFAAVGFWYEDFGQVSDERVRELLSERSGEAKLETVERQPGPGADGAPELGDSA
jgi:putative phosphoribosyl transferase